MPSERGLSHCALLCSVRRNATGVDVARDQAVFRHVVMIARLNQTLLADDYRPAAATSRLSESWTLGTSRREIGQGALGVLALVVYRFLTPQWRLLAPLAPFGLVAVVYLAPGTIFAAHDGSEIHMTTQVGQLVIFALLSG
jgi:hypothetical protein